jgi:dolichyl-phosphate-mannose-protein mannosyltransferase
MLRVGRRRSYVKIHNDSLLTFCPMRFTEVRYFDTVTLRHRQTKVFLHSHPDKYPLTYEDGRVSSQGQQVTGYPFNDTNNHWIVEPTKEIPDHGRGRVVRHKDVIRLLHVNTQSYLMTHDVACPLMATNEEFTTWPKDDQSRYNDTTFKLEIEEAHNGQQWKTKSGHFKLVHVPTRVAMWTRASPVLPDWGFKQQEINGHKNLHDPTVMWYADEIIKNDSGFFFMPSSLLTRLHRC